MISQAQAAALLPPSFQVLTGLSFAMILVIRFVAGKTLKYWWGRLIGFAVIFIALGCFFMSLGTAKSTFSGAAEMLTFAGLSYFLAAVLATTGLVMAARRAD